MKHVNCKKLLTLVMVLVLMAAMALSFTGCGSTETIETTATVETAAQDAEAVTFTVTVTDLEGNEDTFDITTTQTILGDALLDQGLISGDEGEYGLYITAVNGITADWDKDQTYWAFYIDGEYALTGVDSTEIDPNAAYSFVLTKG